MKVYVVTSGEYSDYSICAVFLDKKKAQYWTAAQNTEENSSDPYEIEEYDLSDDSVEISNARPVMFRYSTYEDGTLVFGPPKAEVKKDNFGWFDYCIVSPKQLNADQVEKIKEDLITKYLAEKEGLT